MRLLALIFSFLHLTTPAPAPRAVAHVVPAAPVWPADGVITSPFGRGEGRWHPGVDIGSLRDLRVRAALPGRVVAVGYARAYEGYGNVVVVRSGPRVTELYAHLAAMRVHPGERVRTGERIGVAGCTGYCTGTHLHFELRRRGRPVDPLGVVAVPRAPARSLAAAG